MSMALLIQACLNMLPQREQATLHLTYSHGLHNRPWVAMHHAAPRTTPAAAYQAHSILKLF